MKHMKSIMQKAAQAAVVLSLLAVPLLTVSTPVAAQTAQSEICSGLGQAGGSCGGGQGNALNKTLKFALSTLSLVAGVAAVIMIIIAGMKFITGQGDAGAIASARNTLIYALVGLVVVALAQFIVHFVLGRV
jgi:uncharacterized membrane protein